MTLEQYWAILIKRWLLIVSCIFLVGIGAFVGSKLMKPLYQSSALVQAVISSGTNNQASYDNLLASEQLVQTEADLATSYPVLRDVASRYRGLSESQLAGEVSASPKASTQLFEIDVVDLSPSRAASLANDVAQTLINQQEQVILQNNAKAQNQIDQKIAATSQQINDTTTQISALQGNTKSQGKVALLQAQLTGYQQKNIQLQAAQAQLELTQAQNGNPLQIAQPAQAASAPVRPDIRLNTAGGLLAGLLLGLLLALLFQRLDTRVRTPEEITKLFSWPVLASVWRARSSSVDDVINPTGHDYNAEAYRILRTNIGFASIDKPLHSLVVTSAQPRDGKSVIAANLAIFMARAGKSTLLIDADLHLPTQHTLFKIPAGKWGLSNAVLSFSMQGIPATPSYYQPGRTMSPRHPQNGPITTNQSLEPFVHATDIPNLWVMPSGPLPPNPSELLESKVMQKFLSVIENCGVEIVIFDTPPLVGLSDTSILASKVDGALLVVDTTRATKDKLKQLKAILSRTNVHVLGCVTNKLQHKRNDNPYYYYADEQNGEEKFAGNGHIPPVPNHSRGS